MKLLTGHTSPETAYVVDDYPYGFRLRCKIRYWLEFKEGKGFRFCSQTTNPKRPGETWNKPKASTYCRFGGAMVQADNGHISWVGLTEHCDGNEAREFWERYGTAVPEAGRKTLESWVAAKLAYDAARTGLGNEGTVPDLRIGLAEAREAWIAEQIKK